MNVVRDVESRDFDAIAVLYNYYIKNTTATFAEEPVTGEAIAQKYTEITRERCPFLVVEDEAGRIAGFAYASAFRHLSANRMAELSIYVAPIHTGKKAGKALLDRVIAQLEKGQYFSALFAVITSDNEGSIRFHQRSGFQYLTEWKSAAYKQNKWCDAKIFRYALPAKEE